MKLERLSCRERVERLCDYLDRDLAPSRRRLVAAHRRSCRSCAELLASLERTVATLKELKRGSTAPPSARRALRDALKSRVKRRA